ncbi:cell surface A33 antigen isoform X2 [Pleuronectes platessa]|uniref:cell surface A33 antigen isoform X2 n=1 Tax=Pleuronectes platessa TaxID=8262 RepID=UPI00232A47E1|nr:cell surface A33 antigen isoform X2 [Pleuronectes platessa]
MCQFVGMERNRAEEEEEEESEHQEETSVKFSRRMSEMLLTLKWWNFIACVSVLSSVGALEVAIPQKEYEFARGDNITLPCSFKSKLATPPLVIITWSAEAPTADAKQTLILSYYSNTKQTDIKSMYEGRVSLDVDTRNGRANLKLSAITLADNKVFECRVLIPTDDEGKPAATVRLVVLVAPSTPICKLQGKAEYGQNINLTCLSAEGSPAPTYKWESTDVRSMPRAAPHPRTTDKGGILSMYDITKDTSGYFTCTSSNKIHSAKCNITLAVMPPSVTFGSTAIIAIAVSVVALIALIVIVYCCCRKDNDEHAAAMMTTVTMRRTMIDHPCQIINH